MHRFRLSNTWKQALDMDPSQEAIDSEVQSL